MPTSIDLSRTSGIPSLGTHLFKITKVTEQPAEETPSGYVNILAQCTVQDKGEDQGKQVLLSLSLSPAARWKLDEVLDALKFATKGRITSDALMGKMFRANVVITKDKNGKERGGLDVFLPYDGGDVVQKSMPMTAPQPVKAGLPSDATKKEPPF